MAQSYSVEAILSATDNNFSSVFGAAQKSMDQVTQSTEETSNRMQTVAAGVGSAMKGIGKAMGGLAIAAGAASIKLGKEVLSAYADYEQLVGGVDTLFGSASQTVQGYAENAFKTAGMSANEYMETVTGFSASLIQSLGGDTAKAAQVADMAITDMSDNANKMGSDIGSIQDAYQGFAKQNYTMLDNLKLGYGGTKTEMERLLADAEKFSGLEYDVSSYADVAEAIHVIQTEMGITGTTALEAEETISGSIAGMSSAVKNFVAGLGNADADIANLTGNVVDAFQTIVKNVAPILENLVSALPTAFNGILGAIGALLPTLLSIATNLFTQVLNTIMSLLPTLIPVAVDALMVITGALIENLPLLLDAAMLLLITLVQGIAQSLPTLIPAAVNAITTIVQGLIDNLPMLLEAALQLILGLAQGLLDALPQLIEALPAIIIGLVDFLIAAIPQIIDTGIKLLTSLIEALPKIIDTLVKAIPKIINGLIKAIIGAIPQLIDAGFQLLTALIDNLPMIIDTVVVSIPQIVDSLVDAIIGNIDKIIVAGVKLFVALIKNQAQFVKAIIAVIPKIIKSIVDGFKERLGRMSEVGGNLIKGLWQGISDAGAWLRDKISGFFGGVVDNIKSFFGIHSPSTLFAELGDYMAEGLGIGFGETMEKVGEDMQKAIPTELEPPDIGKMHSYINRIVKDTSSLITDGINPALDFGSISGSISNTIATTANISSTTTDGLLERLIGAVENGSVIVMDGDAVVGATYERYDAKIGQTAAYTNRWRGVAVT
jgi:hypothetical protein